MTREEAYRIASAFVVYMAANKHTNNAHRLFVCINGPVGQFPERSVEDVRHELRQALFVARTSPLQRRELIEQITLLIPIIMRFDYAESARRLRETCGVDCEAPGREGHEAQGV